MNVKLSNTFVRGNSEAKGTHILQISVIVKTSALQLPGLSDVSMKMLIPSQEPQVTLCSLLFVLKSENW